MTLRLGSALLSTTLLIVSPSLATAQDIVLRASNVTTVQGNWTRYTSSTTAAGGQYMSSDDQGWANTGAPLASPPDYFEINFNAPAGTQYHVWFRLRASDNSKYNDSVWVQYSDAQTTGGSAVYRIGTTSGLDVNLEDCSGCGVSGWGWQDGTYWASQSTTIKFANTGSHTIRVQTREDGVQIDQIVLSPTTYLTAAPGRTTGDSTIVPLSGATATSTTASGPYTGTPVNIPGRIQAENFDNGRDGTAYHDNTAGNTGAAYRQTDMDIQGCSAGGFNLAWIEAGEWANYSVNVQSAGSHTVQLRVASPNGGALHIGFNGPSSVWQSVSIPPTGGWQTWTTVNVPVTLGAGRQLMTVAVDRAGFNLDYVEVVSGAVSQPAPAPTPSTGSGVSVATWNVRVDGSSTHARGAIDRLMNLSPRPAILTMQEVSRAQYNTYLDQLRVRTGQTWQGVFQNHCPPGAWNGSSCNSSEDEGVAVFTSLPVTSTGTTFVPYADQWHSARGVARAAVTVNGVTVQVMSVHLQVVAAARYSSMSYLKSYASRYSAPYIVGGDFNADPDQICTASGMSPTFSDVWGQVGSGRGYTAFVPTPTMKIDYLFVDGTGRARGTSVRVATETGSFSDHYPVTGSISVR